MELKNITPFNSFRKILEVRSEFSNEVGFAKSLVGRALFSIIRYFKQGIDIGRLQYMKNKLENEYFAGLLRLLVMKQINPLKPVYKPNNNTGTEDTESPQSTDAQSPTPDDEYPVICGILHLDYTQKNELENRLTNFDSWKEELIETSPDYEGEQLAEIQAAITDFELYLNIISLKIEINDVFEELHKYQETEGTTYDEATTTTIITALDKILTFLKDDRLKHCSRYKLTPEMMAGGNKGVEQLIIKRLATCNPEAIKNKCNEILTFIGLIAPAQTPTPQTPTTESLLNDDNELILEKIGSGIKIMQVLGDSLNTAGDTGQTANAVSTKKYLASVGITTVDQINFKELAKIFHEHPILRNEVATMVSLEGIRNIQYYVSRIIYRIKKTPTYTGITPEIGGGVNQQEDSALRTYWEKLVEKVKGEWIYFINLEDYKLDPFAALTLQEAIRTKNSSGENFSAKVTKVVSAASDTAMADKAGLIAIPTPYSTEKTPVVLQLRHGDNLSYIVCSLHNSTTAPVSKVYRYLGNIDLHKILSENMHQQTDFKTNIAKKYATSIYDADYDTKACSPFLNKYFKLDFSRRNKGTLSYTINGVYFGSNNFQRYSTVGEPQNQRTHCLSVYVESRLGTIPFSKLGPTPKPTIDNDIIVMANGAEVPDNRNLKDSATVALEVGQLFRFEDQSWAEAYFPNYTTQVLPGASTPPAITETDWNAVIKFRI